MPSPVMKPDHLSLGERNAYRSLEDVIGCKWSAAVLGSIATGVGRPGKLERHIPGISTKVLTERLRKLLAYGLITREIYPGAVRHVEYRPTAVGRRLAQLIREIHALQEDHTAPATGRVDEANQTIPRAVGREAGKKKSSV